MGLGLAAAVAYCLMKNNPALPLPSLARDAHEPARDGGKIAKADADKPRFDFYKILPGVEEPKVQAGRRPPSAATAPSSSRRKIARRTRRDRATGAADKAQPRPPEKSAPADPAKAAKGSDRFWLQAGSFSTGPMPRT